MAISQQTEYSNCPDDNETIDRLQILLDWSNRYFDRLETATTNLESKAQQIIGITLAITSVVIPLYATLSATGGRNSVWLVQGLLIVIIALINLGFSLSVAAMRRIDVPNLNHQHVFFSDLAQTLMPAGRCTQLQHELIQLWGNKDRPENPHGVIGQAKNINDIKHSKMQWVSRSFAAFMMTLYVGSVVAAFISMG